MRSVVQRVSRAEVKIGGRAVGQIKKGLLVFLAVHKDDNEEKIAKLAEKIMALRIFSDKEGKMNLSLKEVGGEILVVSQFTLYADLLKGNRPSFINAAKPDFAKNIYDEFIEEIKKEGVKVEQGIFGEKMEVFLINDGPVTFIL